MSDDRNALVLVAHADDETLGCGGTIPVLLQQGWNVQVVIMSDGLISTRAGDDEDNASDAQAACAVLGVPEPTFLDVPDQRFDEVAMADLAGRVGDLGLSPDLILTHAATDLNLDHRLVHDVAKIIGRPRRRPVSILACEIPSTTAWNGTVFPADYYVDVTATITTKLEAFSCYANEVEEPPGAWSLESIELLSRYHGIQSGVRNAEAFHVVRAVGGLLP